jgi:hypothetical protein
MKHLKTYESFEDKEVGTYFYGGRTSILTRVEIKQTLDEIIDNLLDIFDDYNIFEESDNNYQDSYWRYGGNWEYTSDGEEDMVNRVIDTCIAIERIKSTQFDQLVNDIDKLKKTIESRIGQKLIIRLNKISHCLVITTEEIGDPTGSHWNDDDDNDDTEEEVFETMWSSEHDHIDVEIKELLANLLDDGFQVLSGRQSYGNYQDGIIITIDKRSSPMPRLDYNLSPWDKDVLVFKWGEARPEIERMLEYLSDRFELKKTTLQKGATMGFPKAENASGIFGSVLPGKGFDKMDVKFIRIELLLK